MPERLLSSIVPFLVGLVLGTVGTFGHRGAIGLGALNLRWGIVIALAGVACYLVGLRLYTGDRIPTLAGAVGVIAPILVFTATGPGGSVVIAQGWLGQFWELGPAVIALLVLAWPKLPGRPAAHPAEADATTK